MEKTLKTYKVSRISYMSIAVEAENEQDAEDKALGIIDYYWTDGGINIEVAEVEE